MANWDVTSAIGSLRSLLGDGSTDKFEFKANVYPTPDTVTTRFFVGQTRLVPNSLEVFHNGAAVSPSGITDIDTAKGSFTYVPAPSGEVLASFYYQWFTDAEMLEFLNEGVNMLLGLESVSGDFAIGLRPTLMQFACYNAYMRKAAEFAEAVEASAAGYTFKRDQASPNWKELAKAAMENAQAKLKLYLDNPVGSAAVQLRFISYALNRYVGQ
jgi:hypothetical protein